MMLVVVFLILPCFVKLAYSSAAAAILSFNQGDLELFPEINFCKTNPQTLLASIQLTSLEKIFQHVSQATHKFHTYSVAEARQSVLSSVRLELAELLNVKRVSSATLAALTRPIAQYYSSISLATSAALSSYLPTRTALFLPHLHPDVLYQFLTFTPTRAAVVRAPPTFLPWHLRSTSAHSGCHSFHRQGLFLFLYICVFELQALAQATLEQKPSDTLNDALTSTHPNENPPPCTKYSNPGAVLNRVYPSISAPIYTETST